MSLLKRDSVCKILADDGTEISMHWQVIDNGQTKDMNCGWVIKTKTMLLRYLNRDSKIHLVYEI
jgi:hypothetical protein